ncbi:flagellar biosynthetic protein FliO [Paenibacillus yanchengensis]|uniref:Flagellar biosynthetic protein FliO n=1 Tax=Paenibacillus yanchengensis TaxID=2035833 RepID=A0ABW4YMU1_9BACL
MNMLYTSILKTGMPATESSGSLPNDVFPGSKLDNTNMLESLIWLIVALALVVVMIIILIRWLGRRNRPWGGRRQTIQTLGGTPLGQQSSLQVVELAGRLYVLGVHQNGVQLVDKIDNPELVAEILALFENQHEMGNFSTPINNLMKQWKKNRARGNPNEQTTANQLDNKQEVATFETLLQKQLTERKLRSEELKQLMNESKSNERLMDNEK